MTKLKKIQTDLWKECRRITFAKYGNTCYTCGATNLVGSNLHLGHFIPRSTCGALLRYDLRNLRPQCARCNLWGNGEGAMFYQHLEEEIGKKALKQLIRDKQKSVKAVDHYTKLLKEYVEMV